VDDEGLTVSAPWRSSERRITAVIRDAEDWILRKLATWAAHPSRRQSWVDGDIIRYLGRDLRLQVESHAPAAIATLGDGDCLRIAVPRPAEPDDVKALTVKWLRRHAQTHFIERIGVIAPMLEVPVPRLFLSGARTRWGSCNARCEVRLNWRLIQAPGPTIDYVVAHELAHLREMNHSRRFWDLVAGVCPQHRDARAELDRMGRYYMAI
jgi:hypothetical protein